VNNANATGQDGTSAIVVVKVRLLAVRPRRSSRKRSRKVSAAHAPGHSGPTSWQPVSTSVRTFASRYDATAMLDDLPPAAHSSTSNSRELTPSAAAAPHHAGIHRWSRLGACWALMVLGFALGAAGSAPCGPAAPGWRSKYCRCAFHWRACSREPHVHLPLGQLWWCGCISSKAWCAPWSDEAARQLPRPGGSRSCAWCLFAACALHVHLRFIRDRQVSQLWPRSSLTADTDEPTTP